MSSSQYSKVDAEDKSGGSIDDFEYEPALWKQRHDLRQRSRQPFVIALVVLLTVSLLANFVLLSKASRTGVQSLTPSKYAKLVRDVPMQRLKNTSWSHTDRAVEDAAWDSPELTPDIGVVAVDDAWSEAIGLPHSMRWPWDENKGVYLTASSHEIHCLKMLRQALNDFYDGGSIRLARWHALHCLDQLRQTVMCNADDTLLYTGRLHQEAHAVVPYAGEGMTRMCYDWNKLLSWTRARTACYTGRMDDSLSELDRYKACPDDAKPWEEHQEEEAV